MNEIVWGGSRNPEINAVMSRWCSEHFWPKMSRSFGRCATMGVIRDGKFIAVIVFNNWNPDALTLEITGVATDPRWLTRKVLLAMYGYAFDQAGCQLVLKRVSERNKRILKMLRRSGFEEIVLPRLRGRHEDEILCILTEEQWRVKEKELKHGFNS